MAELVRKYVVMALAAEGPFDLSDPDAPFVLKPWKDPAALRALIAYRDSCYPELSRELDVWIRTIVAGPVVRGDVGKLNEPHVRAKAVKKRAPRRRAATKHVRKPIHRKKRKR